MHQYRKDLQPPPDVFYAQQLERVGRPNHQGWATVHCVFHRPDKHPSLRVNMHTGAFKCWSCGAKGGSVIDFVMLADGVSFRDACRQLGCWDEDGRPTPKLKRLVVGRDLVCEFTIDGNKYEARTRDDAKDEVDLLRRINTQAADRLAELQRGDQEKFEGEAETCWGLFADSWQLIQFEVGR